MTRPGPTIGVNRLDKGTRLRALRGPESDRGIVVELLADPVRSLGRYIGRVKCRVTDAVRAYDAPKDYRAADLGDAARWEVVR